MGSCFSDVKGGVESAEEEATTAVPTTQLTTSSELAVNPLSSQIEVSNKRIATRSLLRFLLSLLLILLLLVPRAVGDVGTASYYGPPYERTECYGEGSSQFPKSHLFAAVGDELWDQGAACGREYELRCISEAHSGPGPCNPGSGTIRVKVVDYALSDKSSAAPPKAVCDRC